MRASCVREPVDREECLVRGSSGETLVGPWRIEGPIQSEGSRERPSGQTKRRCVAARPAGPGLGTDERA